MVVVGSGLTTRGGAFGREPCGRPARSTMGREHHLVLATLEPAGRAVAVHPHDPDRRIGPARRRTARPWSTLRPLCPDCAGWAGRPRRARWTGIALGTGRPWRTLAARRAGRAFAAGCDPDCQ